ncbi:MAG: phosphosugar isomerase [Rhodobacterales bacterium]|nr:MAG: phosphosugar isomerase [Rhodobacterales bacterium]
MTSLPAGLTESATWGEIHAQPRIWRDWAAPLAAVAGDIRGWIGARKPQQIWLCGAGTSAYVGDALATGDARLAPVPTTSLVSAPQDYIARPGHGLVVQFGRSGDSSESVAVLDLLDRHRPEWDRLHVTCNPNGALATRPAPGPGEARVLALPEATHDAGFAMTSSFSTMLLSALACLSDFDAATRLPKLADTAEALLANPDVLAIARPERAIFLGSGALAGAARESGLKVLELTAGATMTSWDTALGFRHGPKAAVNGATHVFVLLNPDAHTRCYDADIAAEIRAQFPETRVTTLGPGGDLPLAVTGNPRADVPLYVLLAQLLGTRWSAELGLHVDDPFHGRNLSRVVSGVTFYDYEG